MVFGFDDVANTVGVTLVVVKLLDTAIKGFTLLRTARFAGRDLSTVHALIQIEQQELQLWAQDAGLLQDPPELNIRAKDIGTVSLALNGLEELLADLHKLGGKYKLDIQVTEEEIKDLKETDHGLRAMLPWQRHEFHTNLARVFHRRQSTWRKLHWVSADENSIRRMLDDIRNFNRALSRTLERSQHDKLVDEIGVLRRTLIMSSSSSCDLSLLSQITLPDAMDENIIAAAKLRQEFLNLNALGKPKSDSHASDGLDFQAFRKPSMSNDTLLIASVAATSKSMRLSKSYIRAELFDHHVARQLAYYTKTDKKLILVEWRDEGHLAAKLRRSRAEQISQLLHEVKHSSFHSLQCIGYLEDSRLHRYGFAFDIPPEVFRATTEGKSTGAFPVVPVALREMIDTYTCPPLNFRVRVAIILLKTLLQLHTSGWLHKAIRSDNLVAFQTPLSAQLSATTPFFLVGYAYARSDDPAEITEPSPSQIDTELYRHPLSVGDSRARYRRDFDLFSAGCILLELGLWSSFSSLLLDDAELASNKKSSKILNPAEVAGGLLSKPHNFVVRMNHVSELPTAKGQELLDRIAVRLRAATGEVYADVTFRCLRAASTTGQMEADQGDQRNQEMIQLENECVTALQQMLKSI